MANIDFMKPLFGEDGKAALTFEQLSGALDNNANIKLADLSSGAYVSKGKYDAVIVERDTLKADKAAADTKLVGYEPDWKEKIAAADAEATKKVNAVIMKHAAFEKLRSAGCKDPALAYTTIDTEKIKLDGETVSGLDELIEASKKAHPFLYEDEQQPGGTGTVKIATGTSGKGKTGGSVQDELDAIYKNNPFYKPKK